MSIEAPQDELPRVHPLSDEDDTNGHLRRVAVASTPVQDDPVPPVGRTAPLSLWALAALGAGFLIVCLAQAPGLIEFDTKLPMLLTPISYIESSLHAWNQAVYSGSVLFDTGNLLPMGFFFAITHVLHVPVWCAERVWLALLLTTGCWGLIRLAEALGIGTRSSRVLGGLAFSLSPIVVTRVTTSVTLLAVVLLPWVLEPLVVASRGGSTRRAAARSGVAVALMSGANAVVVAGVLPLAVIWLLTRRPGPRRLSLTLWWIVATGLACFWWVVATLLVGKFGFNYLPFTETSGLTTSTANTFEAVRGSSYWVTYFNLHTPLLPGSWTIVSSAPVILATAIVAAVGLAGLCRRIPERLFLVVSLAFGVVVIAAGYSGSAGGFFSIPVQHLLQGPLAAFRNIGKFSPDVALPLALGVVSALSVLRLRGAREWSRPGARVHARAALVGGLAFVVVLVIAAAPFWQGQLYKGGGFAAIPGYWAQAGKWLQQRQGESSALVVPGSPFGFYTWGNTFDPPIWMVDSSPTELRNIIPLSSNGNIEALDTVENVLTAGVTAPGLAGYLAAQGIKYVVEQNDLNLAVTGGASSPAQVHQVLAETPGLTEVASFGPYLSLRSVQYGSLPVYDSGSYLHLRPVEIFRVDPYKSLVQTYAADDPVVMSGDPGSLLSVLASGVADGRATVLSGDPAAATTSSSSSPAATWALTDGNQRQVTSFGGIRDNKSYVLGPSQSLPGQSTAIPASFAVVSGSSHQTVSAPVGAATVSASSFGSSPLISVPRDGPMAAFDGNSKTAWVANATDDSVGQWISVTFHGERSLTSIFVRPLVGGSNQPTVSRLVVTTDRGSVSRSLPATSSLVRLSVPAGATRHLKLTIAAVRPAANVENGGIVLGAGIHSIIVPGLRIEPRLRAPVDHPLGTAVDPQVVVFNRQVQNANIQLGQNNTAADPDMARDFALNHSMDAVVLGSVVPATGPKLNALLNTLAPVPASGLTVVASSTLGNLPRFRPENVVDGASLPWIASTGDSNPTLTVSWSTPRDVDAITLKPSRYASLPTQVVISTGSGGSFLRHVPTKGGTIKFPAVVTDSLRIHITGVALRYTLSPAAGVQLTLPVGLSNIGIPGLLPAHYAALTPGIAVHLACGQGPTLQIDGKSIETSVSGTLGDVVDLRPMQLAGCGPFGATTLQAGDNEFRTDDSSSAFVVSSLSLRNYAEKVTNAKPRTAHVVRWASNSRTIRVSAGPATYLVLAQNYNAGWVAKLGSQKLNPIRVDGWEQGYVVPAGHGGVVSLVMSADGPFRFWLAVGAALLVLLLVLAILPSRRPGSDAIGARAGPSVPILFALAAAILFVLSGPVALVLIPIFLVGRRWGPTALSWLAFGSFALAGVAAALYPARLLASSTAAGAFSPFAQVATIIALGAVFVAVIVGARRPGHSQSPTPSSGGEQG